MEVVKYTLLSLLGALILSAAIFWDTTLYLSQAAAGQFHILFGARNIEEVIADPATKPRLKKTLELVQDVKKFGEKELGLTPTANYEKYVDIGRDYLVMVLSASDPVQFKPHTWWFPIVGTVPYKGFFDKSNAEKAAKVLQNEGLETYVRVSPAYSTLGWFNDPLLSTMTLYGEYYLINTVIHESTHATMFIPGGITFNENLASFIGNKGSFDYYAQRFGKESKQYVTAKNFLHDQAIFNDFIDQLYQRLNKMYTSNISREQKLKLKPEIIKEMKEKYTKETIPKYKSNSYKGFTKRTWSNPVILSYKRYYQDMSKFKALYEQQGQDIGQMIKYLKENESSIPEIFKNIKVNK